MTNSTMQILSNDLGSDTFNNSLFPYALPSAQPKAPIIPDSGLPIISELPQPGPILSPSDLFPASAFNSLTFGAFNNESNNESESAMPLPFPRSFKARGECLLDFIHFVYMYPDAVLSYTIKSTTFIDIDIEFTSTYTLIDIKNKLSNLYDFHVIAETINLSSHYTGERHPIVDDDILTF